jgi:hypothetical protein
MKKLPIILMLIVTGLVFGCVKEDPQASLAIQIVKNSPITRMGFGPSIEQYYSYKHDLEWKAAKMAQDVYIVTMTDSSGNYGEWEVDVTTKHISWPRVGVIKDGKKIPIL